MDRGQSRQAVPLDVAARFERAYVSEIEAFARCATGGLQAKPSGDDALAAAILCQAAELAIAENRVIDVSAATRRSPKAAL